MAQIVFTEEDQKEIDRICEKHDPTGRMDWFIEKMSPEDGAYCLDHIRRMIRAQVELGLAIRAVIRFATKSDGHLDSILELGFTHEAVLDGFVGPSILSWDHPAFKQFYDAQVRHLGDTPGGEGDQYAYAWAELLREAEKEAISGGRTLQSV